MGTKHGSLSSQEIKRLQGREMILNGFDNNGVADALEGSLSSVRNWRRKLNANNEQLHTLARETG